MMSGAKVQNSVHSCTIRYLTLGPAKYKKGFFMNRKLLFFDIDGTLLAGGIPGYIPDSAIEALKQAQANGHYIFINSGRTYGFMPEAIKEFPFDGYVCGCGTEVIQQFSEFSCFFQFAHNIKRNYQVRIRHNELSVVSSVDSCEIIR